MVYFYQYRPISIIKSKVIVLMAKRFLLESISNEQFGLLLSRKIHEAIGVSQEGIHTIKTKKSYSIVIKLDLSKDYDRESWMYLRMMLIHLGFNVHFDDWVMSCVFFVSFSILINGSTSSLFKPYIGLRHGCPLSPLLFLIVLKV